ncbi:hypothetical protein [Caballeronia sp. INDeC2]|uniref:hypothetical protein n=1 Tax=Caballeronia sp. INDeC2 TaxID=2921747 RepID=UPI0020285693|nr:hypothetical protein [Caballeronia sp. INDeC2]
MTAEEKKIRQMPKGGRKGGAIFPRVGLKDALIYARKLVSKTHVSAQPKDVIYPGVLGAKGSTGDIRLSALKQYGFLTGDAKSNYSADALAKQIAASPQEELIPLYRRAMLKPAVFKRLFDTFHGDTVTKAKLKQRAADLKVHPDETETCVELYLAGMLIAGLVAVEGDRVTHMASVDVSTTPSVTDVSTIEPDLPVDVSADEVAGTESDADADTETETGIATSISSSSETASDSPPANGAQPGPRAVFNVNVTLDSSMDIEKLQKQLELLKRFGAI